MPSGSTIPRKRLTDILRERSGTPSQAGGTRITLAENAMRNLRTRNDSLSPEPTEQAKRPWAPPQTDPYRNPRLRSQWTTPSSDNLSENSNSREYGMHETFNSGGFPPPAPSAPIPNGSTMPYATMIKPESNAVRSKREEFIRLPSIQAPLVSSSAELFKLDPIEDLRNRFLLSTKPEIGGTPGIILNSLKNEPHNDAGSSCSCSRCQSPDTSYEDDYPIVSRGYRNTSSQAPFNHSKE